MNTTLKVKKNTKEALDNLKINDEESYNSVINRIIKMISPEVNTLIKKFKSIMYSEEKV